VSGRAAILTGAFAGPVAWLVMLAAAYPLVPWTCRLGHHLPLWIVIAVTLLAALSGMPLARRAPKTRTDVFIAKAARWLSVGFALVILVSAIPILVYPPCQ
jgi:hypothetical protein